MRRLAALLGLLFGGLLLAMDVPTPAAARLGFEGCWYAKDRADGSQLRLRIVAESRSDGRVFLIQGSDNRSGDGCEGQSRTRELGVLTAEGDLAITAVRWCLAEEAEPVYFLTDTLRYRRQEDTLTNSAAAVFHRERFLAR